MPSPNPDPPHDTRFQPGQSGNPGGRPKGRSLTARLREALEREAPDQAGKTVADVLVDALLCLARTRDRMAIKDVFDRVDGKPVQAVEVSGTIEGRAEKVRRFLAGDGAETETESETETETETEREGGDVADG